MAYASPLPFRPSAGPADAGSAAASAQAPSRSAAARFALDFVSSCLAGDLAAYYRAQSDTLRYLDDGSAVAKYRMPPPASIPGVENLQDYEKRFAWRLYAPDEYRGIFPEWFSPDRPWVPGDDDYLFLGHQERGGGSPSSSADYLVFLVSPTADGGWTVAARPRPSR